MRWDRAGSDSEEPVNQSTMVIRPAKGCVCVLGDVYDIYIYKLYQWEFQDPKMEVLYHIRPYVVVIFTYIGLKN